MKTEHSLLLKIWETNLKNSYGLLNFFFKINMTRLIYFQ